jgi:hypothetical protein
MGPYYLGRWSRYIQKKRMLLLSENGGELCLTIISDHAIVFDDKDKAEEYLKKKFVQEFMSEFGLRVISENEYTLIQVMME